MKKLRMACGVTAMGLTLAACGMGGGSNNADGSASHQSIVIDDFTGPVSDWAPETNDAYVLTKAGALETLTRYDPTSGTLKPMLAQSWKQTGPKAWDIKLRTGVKFQDGTAMDAKAVVGALTHVLHTKTPPAAFTPKAIAGVTAVDDSTVRITTVAPDPLLPYRLAVPNSGILSPKAYAGTSINPVGTGTGPFRITKVIPQQAIDLKRNASYWGGPVKLASAEMRFITDGAKRATQVRTGEAQIARRIPVTSIQDLKGSGSAAQTQAVPRTTELILNNKKAPFNKPAVRQALQAAIDTTAITDSVYQGQGQPAVGPFAPGEPWTPQGATAVKADPAKAKSLLAQAGVKPGSLKIQLIAYNEGAGFSDTAAVIQQQLKAIGVPVTIRKADYAAVEPDMLSGNFQAALLSRNILGDMPDPLGYLTADYTCKGGYNLSHVCDPKLDALVAKAASTKDTKARYALYAQAAAQLQSQAVDVFLFHETESVAVASSVKGYAISPYYTLTAGLSLGTK
jgi:peptide/nickel transport system substrate-binding protein